VNCLAGFECVYTSTTMGYCQQLCEPGITACPSGYSCTALGSLGGTMIGSCQ
jgi:hypothetical protein